MSQFELFAPIEPYATGMLAVDDRHSLYWEQCGNPAGTPVVFLHGGPGSGTSPDHRRFFDPRSYRIVLFDQRGAGKSVPFGDLTDNTTRHLIDDLEKLRRHLEIERWMVFGGSWGTVLGLAYGEAHPESCTAFVLRGIALNRRRDRPWRFDGIRHIFPENWREFNEHIPAKERDDLLAAYHRRLMDSDPTVHMPAARHWKSYEGALLTLLPHADIASAYGETARTLAMARIMAHYKINDVFLGDNELIEKIGRIRHIPAVIVQGRYDILCPVYMADELARAWPEADFHIIPDAAHVAFEPGTRKALVRATERFKTLG
jgi:proline iminopeptidase